MKKMIFNSLLIAGMLTLPVLCQANSAPHWTTNSIDCIDCHTDHMGPTTLCDACHNNDTGGWYSKTSAPQVATHSPDFLDNSQYGTWVRPCEACHDPHVSNQCDVPLVDGTFTDFSVSTGTTTFTINPPAIYNPAWNDPASWSVKTGNERGLILIVEGMLEDTAREVWVDFSSEIVAATSTSITVQGEITGRVSTVNDFKIIYGQYVKSELEGQAVVFKDPTDFAVDESGTGTDSSPNGVCQVCHTQTSHWRSDGTGANHFSGRVCTQCHEHERGFMPKSQGKRRL